MGFDQGLMMKASSCTVFYKISCTVFVPLQIMLWGGPVATVRSRVFFVNYPVSFSLRYLYIRPISRHVCVSVCLFVGHRESSPEDTRSSRRVLTRTAGPAGPHEYRTFCYIE